MIIKKGMYLFIYSINFIYWITGKAETGSKLSLETKVQTIFSCTINTKWSTQIFVQIIQDCVLIFDFTYDGNYITIQLLNYHYNSTNNTLIIN